MMDTPLFLLDSFPQYWIKWSSGLNSPTPGHFTSLIPKMLMFTLAISCLTCLLGTRWQSSRMCTHLLLQELQKYNSLLNNCQLENVGSHQKIPHVQGQRRSTSKMVGGVKSYLESNPIPTRDAWSAQTKSCPHLDPIETEFKYLLLRYGPEVACCRGRGSGCIRPVYGISLLGGGNN